MRMTRGGGDGRKSAEKDRNERYTLHIRRKEQERRNERKEEKTEKDEAKRRSPKR